MTTATETGTETDLDSHWAAFVEKLQDGSSWKEYIEGYEIIEKNIGRGGQGIVHKVRDTTGTEYAAKIISFQNMEDFSELKRLERQTQTLKKLQHEGILGYVDSFAKQEEDKAAGIIDTKYVLITELVDSPTLADLLENHAFTEEELVTIKDKVVDVLKHAHQRGIIHRDVKPSNVTYDEETGEIKLLDFGTAKHIGQTTHADTVGTGTTNYMAPEQTRGETVPESDFYGLGATLITCARGKDYRGIVTPNGLVEVIKKLSHLSGGFKECLQSLVHEKAERRLENLHISAREDVDAENHEKVIQHSYLTSPISEKVLVHNSKILQGLDHPNLSKFTKYEDRMLYEILPQSECLFDLKKLSKDFTEEQISSMISQLSSALRYIHSKGLRKRISGFDIYYCKSSDSIFLTGADYTGGKLLKCDQRSVKGDWKGLGRVMEGLTDKCLCTPYTKKLDREITTLLSGKDPFAVDKIPKEKPYLPMISRAEFHSFVGAFCGFTTGIVGGATCHILGGDLEVVMALAAGSTITGLIGGYISGTYADYKQKQQESKYLR